MTGEITKVLLAGQAESDCKCWPSIEVTNSIVVHTWSVKPASKAGVTRNV